MAEPARITDELLRHVADLARLDLSDEERKTYAGQLASILEYIEKLDALDLSDVEPTAHVFSTVNVFREDVVEPSMPRDEMLKNAPDGTPEFYRVPKIIE